VLAVTSVMRVWTERPALLEPEELTGGRPRRLVRLAPGAAPPQTVAEVIAVLPKRQWKRLSVFEVLPLSASEVAQICRTSPSGFLITTVVVLSELTFMWYDLSQFGEKQRVHTMCF
jgi:hypothetical protein